MKIINLCPHDVNICDEYGRILKTYKQASDKPARIERDIKVIGYLDGIIPIKSDTGKHKVIGLPEPQEGIMYIVSHIVLNELKDRKDLLAPADQVKMLGSVVGCTSFMSNIKRGA